MGQSMFFRLFGLGRMPEPVRSEMLAAGPLVFAEGIRGWLRPNGRLPGGIRSNAIRSVHGALAVTESRLVVSVGKNVAVNLALADAVENAPATITLTAAGFRMQVDVGAAVHGADGTVRLDFPQPLDADDFARLPATRFSFQIAERDAGRLFLKYRWAPGTPFN